MLKLETLKKQYIDEVLNKTGLNFVLYTDAGDFQKAVREVNRVKETINGIFTVTSSSVEYAKEQEIVGVSTQLQFLVPIEDDASPDGAFAKVTRFRESLSQAFSDTPPKLNVTEDKKTYTVVAVYNIPATGKREMLSLVGDSVSFSCTVYFAYLSNAINASDVSITIDGEEVSFLAFGLSRRPSISANQFSDSTNGESCVYSESAAFVVDLTLPAYVSTVGGICANYILGVENDNTPHAVRIRFGEGEGAPEVSRKMIFGESSAAGQGVENVRYTVSLIPYADEGESGG